MYPRFLLLPVLPLLCASILFSGCEASETNGKDHFSYSAFDSRKSFDDNLKNLNGVSEVKNKKFDRLGIGKDPVTGSNIMFGAINGSIEMMSFRWYDQYIAANDLKSLGDLEKEFKLPAETKRVQPKCDLLDGVDCTQVFYLCSSASEPPSMKDCGVSVASAKGGTKMWTSVTWNKLPN